MLSDLANPSRNKGYRIFAQGGCTFVEFHSDTREYEFRVEGNIEPYYEVFVALPDGGIEWPSEGPFDCDCLYYQENFECKHVAAALYFLAASKPGLKSNGGQSYKQDSFLEKGEPVILLCDPNDPGDIRRKLNFKQDTQTFFPQLNKAELGKDHLKYSLSYNYYDYELLIRVEKDRLVFETNTRGKAVFSQLLDWFHRRIENYPHDLNFLTQESRVKELRQALDYHKIPIEKVKPHEVLKIVFSDKEFQIIPQGELEGLYHPDSLVQFFEEELIRKNRRQTNGDYLEEENNPEHGKFNAGFVFHWNRYNGQLNGVYPVMAKGSKHQPTELKVKLDWLQSPYDPLLNRKNNNLEEAFVQIRYINELLASSRTETKRLTLHRHFHDFFEANPDYPLFLMDRYLRHHEKPRKMDLVPVNWRLGALSFHVNREAFTYTLQPLLEIDGRWHFLKDIRENAVLLDNDFILLEEKQLVLLGSPKEITALKSFWDHPIIRYTEANKTQIEQKFIQGLAANYPFHFEQGMIKKEEISTQPARQIYISEMSQFVIFRPILDYGGELQINPLVNGSMIDFEAHTQVIRDAEEEQSFLREIRGLHEQFLKKGNQGFFYLSFQEFIEDLWFLKTFEKLKKDGIEVFGLNDLKNLRFSPYPAKVAFKLDSKQDWFEANMEVAFGNNKVKLKDIKKAIDSGGNYIELTDGSLGILPEKWLQKFGKIFRSGHQEKETIKIAKTHFNLIGEVADERDHQKILDEIAEKKDKLASFTRIENTKPSTKLQAKLRQYQQEGLNWLNFLYEYGWGGILADDMGLGKTLQTIALICQLVEQKKRLPILVVAPTTLLFNWKKELEKFAPHLDYFIHHGQRYEDPSELQKHDLILTSYGVVINDVELLRSITFELIVADESQAIKNAQSLRHKAMMQLKGKLRIALSGTPIENNIGELFAQMNFVNPGFFVSQAAFRRDYVSKFRKDYNEELVSELKNKVAPFILRRTKEEVLPELPDKTEEYLYCEMGGVQRKIYDAHRNEYRDFLLKKFEEEGAENSKMYVLEGLTRLRQICDATALVSHGEARQEAVKIDLLISHITEKTGNHKILVFSQFVKMLELVENALQAHHIAYSYLDGKTSLKEREKRVNQFQEDEEVRVFLVSLKAGGTGLNLTAADYVYILDPWWNPATENQAIDRSHRMGQRKNVFAYRMICKDTVEEKIIQMQEAKKKISKDIIGEGDSVLAELDKDRLLALFE